MNKDQQQQLAKIAGELEALRTDLLNTEMVEPKAEDKWQRVIDEGYLCKFWDEADFPQAYTFDYLIESGLGLKEDIFLDIQDVLWDNCEVLREKGIKQPYFQGDDIPVLYEHPSDRGLLIYFDSGYVKNVTLQITLSEINWSEVTAYIEV